MNSARDANTASAARSIKRKLKHGEGVDCTMPRSYSLWRSAAWPALHEMRYARRAEALLKSPAQRCYPRACYDAFKHVAGLGLPVDMSS